MARVGFEPTYLIYEIKRILFVCFNGRVFQRTQVVKAELNLASFPIIVS